MSPALTSADIRAALKRYFSAPEWAVVFEVARSTGATANRHLDAIAMGLWPSRGFVLHGIEIKVSLNDWRREKGQPEKAEEIARYCDQFSVAAPAGLIPIGELPLPWGLIEVAASGSVKVTKVAERKPADEIGRPFVAALLRASTRLLDPESTESILASHRKTLDEDFERRVKAAAEQRTGRMNDSAKSWEEVVAALGFDPGRFWENTDLIAAIKAVHSSGVARAWSGLMAIRSTLRKGLDALDPIAADLDLKDPDADSWPKARSKKGGV